MDELDIDAFLCQYSACIDSKYGTKIKQPSFGQTIFIWYSSQPTLHMWVIIRLSLIGISTHLH